jgi:hypothetical protein
MELYLSHNQIPELKELNVLGDFHKLIILDLSANDCTINPSYRVFIIYQIRKLKVLDGIVIEPEE